MRFVYHVEGVSSVRVTVSTSNSPTHTHTLTCCLFRFAAHCSNCSSLVSMVFPSFWRTCGTNTTDVKHTAMRNTAFWTPAAQIKSRTETFKYSRGRSESNCVCVCVPTHPGNPGILMTNFPVLENTWKMREKKSHGKLLLFNVFVHWRTVYRNTETINVSNRKFNAEAVHHLLPVVTHADEVDCTQHLSDIQPSIIYIINENSRCKTWWC